MEIPRPTTTEAELRQFTKRSLLLLGLLLVVLYVIASVAMLGNSLRHSLRAKDHAQELVSALQAQELDRALPLLNQIQVDVDRARRWQAPSYWIAAVPVISHDYLFYADLLSAGEGLIYSGDSIIKQIVIDQASPEQTLASLDLKKIPVALLAVQPELEQALARLQKALERADDVHISILPQNYQQEINQLLNLSANLQTLIAEFSPFIKSLPTLLGQHEPHEILILLQNPHELRPTGGFLGTFGRLTFDKGQITNFYTDDIYNVDVKVLGRETLIAPEPIQRFVNVKYWYLRDSNWSPDFPTAAKHMLALYEFESGEQGIDTLVAMTPRLVEEFLRITGPMQVGGLTFTPENLIDTLQHRVEQEFWRIGLKEEERKKIINDLAQLMKQRFFSFTADEAKAFAAAFHKSLDQSEILAYTNIIDVQKELVSAGWAGEIRQVKADYLFIVDANLGALKTDRLVDKTVDYSVAAQPDGRWKATLKLTYKNNGFFDYRTTRYRSYTRVYIPLASELISTQGLMLGDKTSPNAKPEIYTEFDKMVLAGFISVEPGQQRSITYEYYLPSWLQTQFKNQEKYELYMQKQPGTARQFHGQVKAADALFSFAPSSIPYQLVDTQTLNFSDRIDQNRLYTLRFRP